MKAAAVQIALFRAPKGGRCTDRPLQRTWRLPLYGSPSLEPLKVDAVQIVLSSAHEGCRCTNRPLQSP